MPKLNFYDTDAVKAFLLNTLVENKEVREDVDFERRQSQTWFTQYQAQKGRAEAAEAKIAAAVSVLTTPMPTHSTGTVTAEDVNQVIADALALLTGSLKTEGRREMTNTLYEISADFLAALDAMEVDPDTGELLNADQLDALSAAFDEKAEATALYIKNLTAFVGNVKAEEAALAERRKTAEKRVERLKDLLASSMLSVGRDKVETARTKIGFRKSTQVQIDDEGALPPDFVTTTVTTKPDKTAIKKAIQAGQAVAGAVLVENQNLQIK